MRGKKKSYEMLDAIRQQKIDAGLQPFKLVKYFSFSSLAVILVFTLFLSYVISNHARKIMLEQSEEYSVAFAENLNQQVFRRFVVLTALRYGAIRLSNPEQFQNLDKIIREIIQGMNVESVTIYDSKVNIISYSTIKDIVGKEDKGGAEYEKAVKGITNSKILTSGSVLNLIPGTAPLKCRLITYIPFRQVGPGGESGDIIMGVIEIVKDLSSDYKAIIRLQGSIIFVSSVVMMVLFLVLRYIVMNASRKVEHWVVERLQLEEKLNQSERLAHLGSMVATVSHEIKSPLGIIRSTAEILEKRIKKVAPGNDHLARIIVEETNRLNTITMEFLDFARPQQVKLEQGDINTVVKKALVFITPKAAEQEVEIQENLAQVPVMTSFDGNLLYRALLNILVNALQAMKGGGSLHVSTRITGENGIEIEIKDSGEGMSEKKMELIFNPFFTDKNKGTGLGLSITKNIIDSHNGQLRVKSRKGEGTVFTVMLP
ncbi:MAG: ATP-binding protein [Desulfopila sp.]|nr:ATP-binding protein [Desulfopila sp.]